MLDTQVLPKEQIFHVSFYLWLSSTTRGAKRQVVPEDIGRVNKHVMQKWINYLTGPLFNTDKNRLLMDNMDIHIVHDLLNMIIFGRIPGLPNLRSPQFKDLRIYKTNLLVIYWLFIFK